MTESKVGARPLPVEPIRPAYEQVAGKIRDAILDGSLASGERLPVELELTQLFGVSRSTVREALRTLSSQNLITTSRGVSGGTYVAHPNPEYISEYLEVGIGLLSDANEVSVAELTEVRKLLEVSAGRRAAERRTDEVVDQLRACLDASTEEPGSPDFEGNRLFHRIILDAAGNRIVSLLTRPVFAVLRTRFARQEASPEFWVRVHEDHLEITAAIESGDGDAAARLMTAHLDRLSDMYSRIDRGAGSIAES